MSASGASALADFAAAVGAEGPVVCVGGRTQWDVGGVPLADAREVRAPAGVVAHTPAEMIIRVRAGTALSEVQAVAGAAGQMVALEAPARGGGGGGEGGDAGGGRGGGGGGATGATVGGILAVGRGGLRQLRWGPVRDTVLEVTAVNYRGEVFRTGAPLVKNVTGYDLGRLLVGSLGTLALIGEVVLRCRPCPETERWWVAEQVDPMEVFARLYRPLAMLWDGRRTWVGLEGYHVDVAAQAADVLGGRFEPVEGPPAPPAPQNGAAGGGVRRVSPATLRGLPGRVGAEGDWLAEIGVGVLHCSPAAADRLGPVEPPSPRVAALHRAVKERFDPPGRLGPGRHALPSSVGAAPGGAP